MFSLYNILGILVAYLLGSIPFSILIGKHFYGIDVREHGSGNPGATNTFRVLGKRAGIVVLFLDTLKGFIATSLAFFYVIEVDILIDTQLVLGVVAVLGHVFPIYTKFKGGKGIATALGMLLSIAPSAALICIAVFIVTLLLTQYVSLSSIVTSIVFPILVIFIFKIQDPAFRIFAIGMTALIIYTHFENIERLIKGEENKTYLFKKKPSSKDN